MLALQLHFIDSNGKDIPPGQTRLASDFAVSSSKACPEIKGGDLHGGSGVKVGDKLGQGCSNTVSWYVKRHPTGMSLYFNDPEKIRSFFEKNSTFKEIWQSRFIQGIFHDPLGNASIRAEDLGLQGLEGTFIATLFRESLAAHAQLHYDVVHGRKGFVYSFVRNECAYASKALPIIARVLARSGYSVQKMKEPILEMRIGLQRVFITQYETRVYIANGLEALLNVIDRLPTPDKNTSNTPVVLAVRGEAFLDNFLSVMTGKQAFEIDLGFGLTKDASDTLSFPAGRFSKHLRPKLFKGVLAGIPHDAFAAAVTSFYLPPDMAPEEWKSLATTGPGDQVAKGPDEGGLAFVWDLSAEEHAVTDMGVIIASQKSPDDVQQYKNLFVSPENTDECGGGTVFLAATSSRLLTRMKEACERQSLSVLDWERGAFADEFSSKQYFFFVNPGTGMRELFLAGGAASKDQDETRRNTQYENAKDAMCTDSEKVFAALPIFAYSGNAAPEAVTVRLQGITLKQGVAR